MYSPTIGASSARDTGAPLAPAAEKRAHESSSDDEQKNKLPHPTQFSSHARPAIAKKLRSQVADSASAADLAILGGPLDIVRRISTSETSDYSTVYQVRSPHTSAPLAAKVLDPHSDQSDSEDDLSDPLTFGLHQYQKIGAHPNLTKNYGIGTLAVDGVRKDALVMDAGDMTLHDAIDVFEQARVDNVLSDHAYFGVVLPFLARAMFNGAAHCAAANVAHGDIDPANLLLFRDGRPPQLIDLHRSKEHPHAASSYWHPAEVAAGNRFTAIYPFDSQLIATTLRYLGGPVSEGGVGLGPASTPSSAQVDSLRRLLVCADAYRTARTQPHASDLDFLDLGSDEQARHIFVRLFPAPVEG